MDDTIFYEIIFVKYMVRGAYYTTSVPNPYNAGLTL